MKKILRLLFLSAFLLTGCNEETQNSTLLLYETQVTPGITAISNATYDGYISIGPPGKTVPVRISWSAGPDNIGCLKIMGLKVERTGGDPGVVISNVKEMLLPDCMMKWGADTTRFQVASISLMYETSKGLKSYSFKGPVASIQGNGEFISFDPAHK